MNVGKALVSFEKVCKTLPALTSSEQDSSDLLSAAPTQLNTASVMRCVDNAKQAMKQAYADWGYTIYCAMEEQLQDQAVAAADRLLLLLISCC